MGTIISGGRLVRAAALVLLCGAGGMAGCANELLAGQTQMREQLVDLYEEQILQSLAAIKAGTMPLMIAHGDITQGVESSVGASFGVGDADSVTTNQSPGDGDAVVVKIDDSDKDEVSFSLSAGVKGTASLKTKLVNNPTLYLEMRKFADRRLTETEPREVLHAITLREDRKSPRVYYIADEAETRKELGAIFEMFITGKSPEKEKQKFASRHTMAAIEVASESSADFIVLRASVTPPMPPFRDGECKVGDHTLMLLGVQPPAPGADWKNTVWLGLARPGSTSGVTPDGLRQAVASAGPVTVEFNPPAREEKKTDRWDDLASALVELPKAIKGTQD